jgi:GH43 family beta-xylosidase
MHPQKVDTSRYPLWLYSIGLVWITLTLSIGHGAHRPAMSGNPLFEGWYADPEGIIIDNEYWIFPTYSAPYKKQLHLDAFSSKDLVTWTKHEHIIDHEDITWLRQALWAPAIVEKDKKFYLFFGANDVHEGEIGGIGVAVADRPGGPYKDMLGKPLIGKIHNGAQPIDQFVFLDQDGQYYMIYGGWSHCNIAKMKDDFTGFIPFDDGTTFKEITPQGYVEGPIMFHRDGKYYFMWSEGGWGGPHYSVAYAIADSPLGPFKRIAKVLQQDRNVATGAGHHSVIHDAQADIWYAIYHRRPLTETDANHRVTCIDRMYFDEKGFIKPIKITLEGVKQRTLTQTGTFRNPVVRSGADPWVIRHAGAYFLCQSRRNGIWVNRFNRLQDIGQSQRKRVWTPPANTPYSRELWAPELHFIRGKWYIYVAADDGNNHNHRMVVLEGSSDNPQDPFVFKGKIAAPTDRWAIDGTVLQMKDGRLYFIWSGWEGFENGAQHLYIAPMSNPWTISGKRVKISSPERAWELNGRPLINEGPQVLWKGDTLFVIYSASGSWTDDYCLGQLTWTGGDPCNPKSWIKAPDAVFSRSETVFGPGHCSFVESRDSAENWIVYHSAKHSGAGWNRQINMQRFTWNLDGSPDFGRPIAPGVLMPEPSGDSL